MPGRVLFQIETYNNGIWNGCIGSNMCQIENPNCFARSGMVSMRSHVSREFHDLVVAVCMS